MIEAMRADSKDAAAVAEIFLEAHEDERLAARIYSDLHEQQVIAHAQQYHESA